MKPVLSIRTSRSEFGIFKAEIEDFDEHLSEARN